MASILPSPPSKAEREQEKQQFLEQASDETLFSRAKANALASRLVTSAQISEILDPHRVTIEKFADFAYAVKDMTESGDDQASKEAANKAVSLLLLTKFLGDDKLEEDFSLVEQQLKQISKQFDAISRIQDLATRVVKTDKAGSESVKTKVQVVTSYEISDELSTALQLTSTLLQSSTLHDRPLIDALQDYEQKRCKHLDTIKGDAVRAEACRKELEDARILKKQMKYALIAYKIFKENQQQFIKDSICSQLIDSLEEHLKKEKRELPSEAYDHFAKLEINLIKGIEILINEWNPDLEAKVSELWDTVIGIAHMITLYSEITKQHSVNPNELMSKLQDNNTFCLEVFGVKSFSELKLSIEKGKGFNDSEALLERMPKKTLNAMLSRLRDLIKEVKE
jgi:hypothetical protein